MMFDQADSKNRKTHRLLRQRLTMGPCPLFEATAVNEGPEQKLHRIDRLGQLISRSQKLLRVVPSDGESADVFPQFTARLSLVRAFLTDGDLSSGIRDVIEQTASAWHFNPQPHFDEIENQLPAEPSFFPFQQRSSNSRSLPAARLESMFRDIVNDLDLGWLHPGVQMTGELLADLCDPLRRTTAGLPLHTWILFAADHPADPKGIVGRLKMERVSSGTGLLLPDSKRCGYLSMTESFSGGLQNALWAVRQYLAEADSMRSDWRWSIELERSTRRLPGLPIVIPLQGRSAEAAFACAMIATTPRQKVNDSFPDSLDQRVAITAALASPGQHRNLELQPVGAVEIKVLLDEDENGNLGHSIRREARISRIREIVVANEQWDEDHWSEFQNDSPFQFCSARTLPDALELICDHPRKTLGVNHLLHQQSKKLLQERCNPFVKPDLRIASTRQNKVESQPADGTPTIEVETLTPESRLDHPNNNSCDELVRYLRTGTASSEFLSRRDQTDPLAGTAPRVFIRGDSGLGKSTLILWLEYALTESLPDLSASEILPVRVGRVTDRDLGPMISGGDASLSSIPWQADTKTVLASLLDSRALARAVHTYQKSRNGIDPDARWSRAEQEAFFGRLVANGQAVFLLDALDQTEKPVEGLGEFLSRPGVVDCPVVMTGRPEALFGRREAFLQNDWTLVDIQPFDRKRQVAFLGKKLTDRLLLPDSETKVNWSSTPEDLRRSQWQDLVSIPLLIKMLKELASDKAETGERLEQISGRFELYDRSVKYLIRKGLNSISSDQTLQQIGNENRVVEILGEIAWLIIQQHDFRGVLADPWYSALKKILQKKHGLEINLMDALRQIDITTAYQVMECGTEGLEFRHRSFMEFFAGWHMQSGHDEISLTDQRIKKTYVANVSESYLNEILEQVHSAVSESAGTTFEFDLPVQNRLADWQETLRFALGVPNFDRREYLARKLISFGNPWTVFESIKRDRTQFSPEVEALTRVLVSRDWPDWFDYRSEISEATIDKARSFIQSFTAEETDRIKNRKFRDAAYLSSLRELSSEELPFFTETSHDSRIVTQISELDSEAGSWNFLDSFVEVTGGQWNVDQFHPELGIGTITIESFELADFPITNQLFSLFCPSHFRTPHLHSDRPDDPVLHVTHFMATECCRWLSELTGQTFRLPHEFEWEWATRWKGMCLGSYWWGDRIDNRRCWYRETSHSRRVRSRSEARSVFSERELAHPSFCSSDSPGLLDLLGNVLEWCQNRHDFQAGFEPGASFVIRGGYWYGSDVGCLISDRDSLNPRSRNGSVSFRVVREIDDQVESLLPHGRH